MAYNLAMNCICSPCFRSIIICLSQKKQNLAGSHVKNAFMYRQENLVADHKNDL